MKKKTIVICNFSRFNKEIWFPILWTQAKTYYEKHGKRVDEWEWYPSYCDVYSIEHEESIKKVLLEAQPDIFAISLYVWNYKASHKIAKWVKETWPNCIVITGGPHQYFKHDLNWFREHPHIDASLPGECYGELCFQEIMDNYDNGKVDWNQITDIRYPVGKARLIGTSSLSMSKSNKKSYDYNWAAAEEQLEELKKFEKYKQEHFPNSKLLGMVETTRGCPYGCTYCDWGGGINTSVIKKDVDIVKRDVDALSNFHLHLLYICDANFGIFGARDLEIIKYIAKSRMVSGMAFKVWYGGFAKTENKLDYVRQIVEVDLNNQLSQGNEVKLSIQTLDPEILKNIDRVSIPYEKQLAVFEPIATNKKIPFYGEIILGLPGMTLDKFYYEMDVFGSTYFSIQWYGWILMPETPAYARDYRERFGLKTVIKNNGWFLDEYESQYEMVVASSSYTTENYMQMVLSSSMYNLLVQGGYYKNTIEWIKKTYDIPVGKLVRDIYEEFFLKDDSMQEFRDHAISSWDNILLDSDIPCSIVLDNTPVYGGWYFVALAFLEHERFSIPLMRWLKSSYQVPRQIIKSDHEIAVHKNNFQKTIRNGFNFVNCKKDIPSKDVNAIINLFRLYRHSGKIFTGTKRFLGVIPL